MQTRPQLRKTPDRLQREPNARSGGLERAPMRHPKQSTAQGAPTGGLYMYHFNADDFKDGRLTESARQKYGLPSRDGPPMTRSGSDLKGSVVKAAERLARNGGGQTNLQVFASSARIRVDVMGASGLCPPKVSKSRGVKSIPSSAQE